MLYALLIYENPADFARRESAVESEMYAGAWRAYHRAMLDAGIFVGGKPLDAPETATTVRLRDSKREIQDGPFANTKEQLGGFTLLELPSLDAAWSRRRLRAAVKSHACGLFGIPSRGQFVNAATNASANASSAPAISRVRAASSATRRP